MELSSTFHSALDVSYLLFQRNFMDEDVYQYEHMFHEYIYVLCHLKFFRYYSEVWIVQHIGILRLYNHSNARANTLPKIASDVIGVLPIRHITLSAR